MFPSILREQLWKIAQNGSDHNMIAANAAIEELVAALGSHGGPLSFNANAIHQKRIAFIQVLRASVPKLSLAEAKTIAEGGLLAPEYVLPSVVAWLRQHGGFP